jgi:hypothetical protein
LFVRLIAIPKDTAGPPAVGVPVPFAPAVPPHPIMYPLLTSITESPLVPPVMVKPALVVAVAYKYTPLLTVIVMFECPARYPEMEATLIEALAVLAAKVYEILTRLDLP